MTISKKHTFIKVNNFLFISIAFLLPLQKELLSIAILLFFVSSLFIIKTEGLIKRVLKYIPLFLFFIITILSLSYSENISKGLSKIETLLAFIAIPLGIVLSDLNIKKQKNKIAKNFIDGNLIAILAGIITATLNYILTHKIDAYIYGNISIFTHNSYFSMYINFALILCYYYSFITIHSKKRLYLIIFVLNLAILLAFSKTGLITLILTSFVTIGYRIFILKKYWTSFIILLTSLILSFAIYSNSKTAQHRINEFTDSISQNKQSNTTSTSVRFEVWKVAILKFKEQPLLGYGIGSVQNTLNKEYRKQELTSLQKRKLNPHNMFLQLLLSNGIVGFISLISIFYSTIKSKHYISLFLILLLSINFLTESMLIKREGVVFFVLFTTIFIGLPPPLIRGY